MKLVIVESPAKAKTIERFLGPEYRVAASYGHVRDLPASAREVPSRIRKESWARMAVDTDTDFRPVYVIPKESRARINELKKMVQSADELLLATDEDREGESISWHLKEVLEPDIPVRRITFHEITRAAISRALESPRDVDDRLVQAQEARRVLDRLFGYSLSPVLWKKVRTKLSAGRVQSVALRLVVEREEERQAFRASEYWDVEASFAGAQPFAARLVTVGDRRVASSRDFDATTGALDPDAKVLVLNRERATEIAESARDAVWKVALVEQKEGRQRPQPPFITSTLQQAASSRLKMSPKRTMRVAQKLYEGVDLGGGDREGLITYMRTDSVTLSREALEQAGALIRSQFGDEYHDGPRTYKTKAKGAQEAHEAIRPSDLSRTPEQVAAYLDRDELRLYELIWRRAVASQMTDARLDRTTAEFEVEVDGTPTRYRAAGSVLRFPGFLAVAGSTREDALLPHLEVGDIVPTTPPEQDPDEAVWVDSVEPDGHETRPPPRYTEASLVKQLEELGIGRPSTYTPTISTIQDREYVKKEKNQLIPTFVGMAVTHLLRGHFSRYVDIDFTARMEEELDEIAAGRVDFTDFLQRFYRGENAERRGLEQAIEEELPRIDYPAIPIGADPETEQPIFVRIGRNHVFVQRGEGDEGKRATVPIDVLIDELTVERAADLLEAQSKAAAPIGTDEATGLPIFLRSGPYGPYVQLGEQENDDKPKRVGLPKGMDLSEVTLDFARQLISLPRVLGEHPETGKPVTAGLGRFGPYVESGGTYRSITSFQQIFEVGLDEAVVLIQQKRKSGKTVLREIGTHPETGAVVQVLDGRYGPYVTDGKLNASLSGGQSPDEIDMTRAVAMLVEAAERKKTRRGRRKK